MYIPNIVYSRSNIGNKRIFDFFYNEGFNIFIGV